MLHDSYLLRLIYIAIKRSKWESWSISCYLCPGPRHIILALNTALLVRDKKPDNALLQHGGQALGGAFRNRTHYPARRMNLDASATAGLVSPAAGVTLLPSLSCRFLSRMIHSSPLSLLPSLSSPCLSSRSGSSLLASAVSSSSCLASDLSAFSCLASSARSRTLSSLWASACLAV
jgi:hypothetical protein